MLAVDFARDTIADLIGAKPSEVYFTSGGTESDNWAIVGGAEAKRAEGKNRVLVSSIEHHAALAAAERLQKQGFTVDYIPVNGDGIVELSTVESLLLSDVALVCVMAANNETGALQPIKEIAELAKSKGALFFTDAVQLAPHEKIDVKGLGVDMLSFSGHKFYGPKGIGVLYIKSGVKIEKFIGGGEQERGLRGGTVNVPSVVGMAAAYQKNVATMYETNEKIIKLRNLFLKEISELDGVHINGKNGLPSILNLRVEGIENAAFLYAMDLKGVAFSAGSACASASVKPSHVLTAMGLSEAEAKECVRISFGKENTEEEILLAAKLFKETVLAQRKK
jgi:cysteine desulfurase